MSPGAEGGSSSVSSPVLLYDGVCALCNRTVRSVLRRDRRRMFRFAALQSGFAASVLSRHQRDPKELSTVVVVLDPGAATEALLTRSEAAIYIGRQLGGFWKALASLAGAVPRAIRDALYDLVARWRYRVFGRYETCPIPSSEERARFIDI
ncbi:MAG TPA: DCC1-like thiol-disulfide oxidoreductase family protein [Terriglobales bacterium]|nr:DCC1-like thiol-disulfide oxidoreductase family protein [Terriglobales bacterium]